MHHIRSKFDLSAVQLTGSSSGALLAVLVSCNVDPRRALQSAHDLCLRHAIFYRPLGLAGVWGGLVRQWLQVNSDAVGFFCVLFYVPVLNARGGRGSQISPMQLMRRHRWVRTQDQQPERAWMAFMLQLQRFTIIGRRNLHVCNPLIILANEMALRLCTLVNSMAQ